MKKLIRALIFMVLPALSPITANAEEIALVCKMEGDWETIVTLNLSAGTLLWQKFGPVPIAEVTDEWIVALGSFSLDASETTGPVAGRDFVMSEQWVINRSTGDLWANHFGFSATKPDASDAAFRMDAYRGRCTSGF